MNCFWKRAVVALLHSLLAAALFAQGYPQPSKTPNTDVTCTTSECNNRKNVGYTLPLSSFTGRFLDSHSTNDYQGPFRTGRSGKMALSPDGKRLYLFVGSAVFAYDTAAFFSRLASGEAMMPVSQLPALPYPKPGYQGTPETFLKPERFFFAEAGGAGWITPYVDGQARLNDYDVDDQGYVYLSHYVFGWGIVKDDLKTDGTPQLMPSSYQNIDTDCNHILAFKNGSHYYVLVNTGAASVWDVTNHTAPSKVATYPTMNFFQGAKNAAGDRVAIADGSSSSVLIFTAEALANNGSPLATFRAPPAAQYSSITSDGTNFYATFNTPNLKVAVFAPNASGTTYTQVNTFDTGYGDYSGAATASADGYLTIVTTYTVLVFKINSDHGFTELPLRSSWFAANGSKCGSPTNCSNDSFFNQYYFNVPNSAYAAPSRIHATEARVVKSGGNTYLMFSGFGLADVYQLQTGDSISLSTSGTAGTQNNNTPVSERTKTFYGDPIGFTATTTAVSPMNISWNFGNLEAVVDPMDATTLNTTTGLTGPTVVKHRYTGIANAAALTSRTVTTTNLSDTGIFATTSVTMLPPVPRIGLSGFGTLFTQSTSGTGIPIVVGDNWFDASDGSVQGHKSKWSLYAGVSTPTGSPVNATLTPDQPQDVGACGANYISFVGAYGDGAYTIPAGGLGISYTVQPFAANVTMSAQASTVTFTNATKLSTNMTALPPAASAALTYKWVLLDPAGSVVTASNSCGGSPFTGDGPSALLSAIQPWAVPKCVITQRGMKVRLTVSSTTPLCGGVTSSQFTTAALNPPDPVIVGAASCTGSPCTFTVSSTNGVNQVTDGWTYQWGVTGPASAVFTNNTGSSFTVSFTQSGTYSLALTATNNVGSTQATPVNAIVSVQLCGTMVTSGAQQNVSMSYSGSGCSTNTGGICAAGTPVSFSALDTRSFPGGYNFAACQHTFAWSYGDGTTGTGQSVSHTYGGSSTYTATLTITNVSSQQQVSLTANVTVGASSQCATMVAGINVLISYFSNSQSCAQATGCYQNEAITFQAAGTYNYSCSSNHTFLWSFGDGGTATGQVVSHAYATANTTYPVSVTIVGPTSTATPTANVKVGGANPNNGGGACGTMVTTGALQNVSMTFSGATCSTNTGGNCTLGDTISFSALDTHSFTGGYNFSCATHSFAWSFGDGSTGSGQSTSHVYSVASTYTVSLTITNTSDHSSVTLTQQLKAGNGVTCVAPRAGTDVYIDFLGQQTACSEFNSEGKSCQSKENIQFTIKFGNNYPATCVTAQSWNFGDSSANSTAPIVTHAFTTGKTYTVTLNLTVNGQVTPVTQTVVVKDIQATPITSWDFAVQPLAFNGVAVPNAFVFMASSVPATNPDGSPAVGTWNWNFGDGVINSQPGNSIVTHSYTDSAPHTVTLTIPGVDGQVRHVVGTPRRRSAPH